MEREKLEKYIGCGFIGKPGYVLRKRTMPIRMFVNMGFPVFSNSGNIRLDRFSIDNNPDQSANEAMCMALSIPLNGYGSIISHNRRVGADTTNTGLTGVHTYGFYADIDNQTSTNNNPVIETKTFALPALRGSDLSGYVSDGDHILGISVASLAQNDTMGQHGTEARCYSSIQSIDMSDLDITCTLNNSGSVLISERSIGDLIPSGLGEQNYGRLLPVQYLSCLTQASIAVAEPGGVGASSQPNISIPENNLDYAETWNAAPHIPSSIRLMKYGEPHFYGVADYDMQPLKICRSPGSRSMMEQRAGGFVVDADEAYMEMNEEGVEVQLTSLTDARPRRNSLGRISGTDITTVSHTNDWMTYHSPYVPHVNVTHYMTGADNSGSNRHSARPQIYIETYFLTPGTSSSFFEMNDLY